VSRDPLLDEALTAMRAAGRDADARTLEAVDHVERACGVFAVARLLALGAAMHPALDAAVRACADGYSVGNPAHRLRVNLARLALGLLGQDMKPADPHELFVYGTTFDATLVPVLAVAERFLGMPPGWQEALRDWIEETGPEAAVIGRIAELWQSNNHTVSQIVEAMKRDGRRCPWGPTWRADEVLAVVEEIDIDEDFTR
jgi:hypothetical protein